MSIYSLNHQGVKHLTDSVYKNTVKNKSLKQLLTSSVKATNKNSSSSFKTSIKQTIYSNIDSFNDPLRNIHSSRHPRNFETMMHQQNYHMKKYQHKPHSTEKDWKSSIRTYHTEITQQSISPNPKQNQPPSQVKRNPIVNPPSPKQKKKVKKTQFEKLIKNESKFGKKPFQNANSSLGFVSAMDCSTPTTKITIISPRYGEGVQMKQIFSDLVFNNKIRK